jgi:aryl-alcohol dehydrogenase-like predicted oxidoreductase
MPNWPVPSPRTLTLSPVRPNRRYSKARLRLLEGAHSEQQSYSIFVREPEAELLPACLSYGVGVMAYSPLDGGWLSGKYRRGQEAEASGRQRLQPGK